jgi:hypothetical protein
MDTEILDITLTNPWHRILFVHLSNEETRLLQGLKAHYSVYLEPTIGTCPSQLDPLHIITSSLLKIQFIIYLFIYRELYTEAVFVYHWVFEDCSSNITIYASAVSSCTYCFVTTVLLPFSQFTC